MKTKKTSYFKKSVIAFLTFPLMGITGSVLTSCADMLDTKSDMVGRVEDSKINTPEDSLNYVTGAIRCMQVIADRTLLLGELRADLMTPSVDATTAIQQMAANDFSAPNQYNNISDYYAVINNCNYFIENADTTLDRLGKKIFEKEYAVMKTYRAWTYLQLAKIYGKVPLVLKPLLTEKDALTATQQKYADINEICSYFIDDLKPYVDTEYPQYGQMGTDKFESPKFFIPVRVLLGEMCLWTGRYDEACSYFYNYLARKNQYVPTYTSKARWDVTNLDFTTASMVYSISLYSADASEIITFIPMENNEFYGIKSYIQNLFSSTETNYYHYQAGPSNALFDISKAQDYCYVDKVSETKKDTVYAPKTGFQHSYEAGDLRLSCFYYKRKLNQSENSEYSSDYQQITKMGKGNFIPLYRRQMIYLMFAEALNRAGYPESAFCILKYGLTNKNIEKYVSEDERTRAAAYLDFNDDIFDEYNTLGIHARGCGDVDCDTTYCIPASLSGEEETKYVEDLIITEMALEGAFEGYRFYDLMRIALRRNDPAYLAEPISRRAGEKDEATYSRLMDSHNWYLPIQ